MCKLIKKTGICILSVLLLVGCTSTNDIITDETIGEDNQSESNDDEHLFDQEPISSDISFMQEIQEVPSSYYDVCDQQGTLHTFYYNTYDYDGTGYEEQKYAIVYTPYEYDYTKSYDIFYLMHGASGYAEIFLGSPGQETDMKNRIDHMIED